MNTNTNLSKNQQNNHYGIFYAHYISKQNRDYLDRKGEVINAPSVTEILHGKGSGVQTAALAEGDEVHNLVINFFVNPNEEIKKAVQENQKAKKILITLARALKSYGDFEVMGGELSCYCEVEEGIAFVGTCDLLIKLKDGRIVVIDLKTGVSFDGYDLQLSGYAAQNYAELGFIIGEDCHITYSLPALKAGFHKFKMLVKAYYQDELSNGRLLGSLAEVDEAKLKLLKEKVEIKESLDKEIKELKDELTEGLEYGKSYKYENLLIIGSKPKEICTLKPIAEEKLKLENPEYFCMKAGRGFFKVKTTTK